MVSFIKGRILDHGIALFVATPTVLIFWRNVWYWLDNVLTPWDLRLSAWCCCLLGHCVIFILTLGQERLVALGSTYAGFRILAPTFNTLYAVAAVCQWRSTWLGVEILTGSSLGSALRGIVISVLCLCTLRSLGTAAICPPLFLPRETKDAIKHFAVPTWYRSKITGSIWRYLLDVVFTVFVVESCAVMLWRSAWLLADLTFYPEQPPIVTVLTSLLLGWGLTLTIYLSQDIVSIIYRRLSGLPRILFQDSWLLFLSMASINMWRGIWRTLDLILPPGTSCSLALMAVIAAYIAQAFFGTTLLFVKGVVLDSDFSRDKMADLRIKYFRGKSQNKRKISPNPKDWQKSPEKVMPLMTDSKMYSLSTPV